MRTCSALSDRCIIALAFSAFLAAMSLCSVFVSKCGAEVASKNGKPNLVFILVDDLGWSDLGCYGNDFIETPWINSLAADGMRFTAAYTAPVCTPSRGMILSGQSSARTGLYKVPFPGNDRPWARVVPPENWGTTPVDSKPIGAVLASGGYTSKLVGKVHVPKAFVEGMNGETNVSRAADALGQTFYEKLVDFSRENPGKQVGPITQQAIEFIASNKDQPFFCYVGHHIPHIPLVAREELTRKYEAKSRKHTADIHPHYAAMCEAMDESVGLILEAIDQLGLSKDTMVVFFSDNGGVARCFYDDRGEQITEMSPLRGEKGGVYEGGIRVPMIVRWPGHVEPGTVCETPVISTDFLPTFAEAAGVSLPDGQIVDGVSLVPLLHGEELRRDGPLCVYFPDYHHDFPGSVIRDGDLKLIESADDGRFQLYDLSADLGEQFDLSYPRRDEALKLREQLHGWLKELGAMEATRNPRYDPWRQHLLDPNAESVRQRYLPIPWPPAEERAGPEPFVREVSTGYLVDCTFRAIRAYPWNRKVPLSGWETDDRGGYWASSPVGFLPDMFGFHIDRFRLCDTSTEHEVTIRRQIARQTDGRLTWEFRFMMPERMDGARWQLRDMRSAVVGLVVDGGQLCWEHPGREPEPLTPILNEEPYGIRVDVDLKARQACLSVNGSSIASEFRLPDDCREIDYVLIGTGREACGDLHLPVVSIHKGYRVNERFLTSDIGTLPTPWQRTSQKGTASVQPFRGSAKPDIHSLRMANGAMVEQTFPSALASTVVESRLLTPRLCDGAGIQVCGREGTVAAIVARGGDLCYVTPEDESIVLRDGYRENFWYDVSLVLDFERKEAEASVNGKVVATDLPLPASPTDLDTLRLVAPDSGVVWIDDLRVYSKAAEPADYVPEPKPVNQKDDYLIGTQSCSLWKEGDAYAGWDYVFPFAERRQPYLGWYDEGSPEVADWEIKWQVEHGIDFEQYCWYRPDDAKNRPIKSGVLEHGIRDGLFRAKYSHLKQFTIMYTNSGAGRTNADDWQRHIIPYWIEYFFQDPRYLKIDGRPVLAIYHLGNFLTDFGGIDGAADAITVLHKACRDAGLPGVIILCEERYAKQASIEQMKAIGIDHCYAYTWITGDVDRQRKMLLAQRDVASEVTLGVVPSVSVGWEPTPWGKGGDGWATVEQYEGLLKWTKDVYMPTLPENGLGRRMVLLPNWNEFSEGHFIMPSRLGGFGYLDALRNVFSDGGLHEDVIPTPRQRARLNLLYPRPALDLPYGPIPGSGDAGD